ncbi:MAG: hypothetical protein KIH01_08570 [Candidatus Freyarchaeota archaeon]|nr:hypothetical protein [Candidatus Jordarchaeia archaeon]
MPVGNPQVIKAVIATLKGDPLVSPANLRLIVKSTLEYAQRNYGFGAVDGEVSLDELEKMLLDAAEKHPCEEALTYGIAKGESLIEGSSGIVARHVAKKVPGILVKSLGLHDLFKDSTDLYDCLSRYKNFLVKIGLIRDEHLVLARQGSDVYVKLSGHCNYANACTSLNKEGVHNIFGEVVCTRLITLAGIAETALGKGFDIKVTSYNPPNCEGKIFEAT